MYHAGNISELPSFRFSGGQFSAGCHVMQHSEDWSELNKRETGPDTELQPFWHNQIGCLRAQNASLTYLLVISLL